MQDELLALWDEIKFTVIRDAFDSRSGESNRIYCSRRIPDKAEINSVPRGKSETVASAELSRKIHAMLFADDIEDTRHD